MLFMAIGFGELIVACLIGFVCIGPERLPDVARQGGRWARKARNSLREVNATVRTELNQMKEEAVSSDVEASWQDLSHEMQDLLSVGYTAKQHVNTAFNLSNKPAKTLITKVKDIHQLDEKKEAASSKDPVQPIAVCKLPEPAIQEQLEQRVRIIKLTLPQEEAHDES